MERRIDWAANVQGHQIHADVEGAFCKVILVARDTVLGVLETDLRCEFVPVCICMFACGCAISVQPLGHFAAMAAWE